jgi:NADH-quinone oxidoreductase subunit B
MLSDKNVERPKAHKPWQKEKFDIRELVLSTQSKTFFDLLEKWGQENYLLPFAFGKSCCTLEFENVYHRESLQRKEQLAELNFGPENSDLLIIMGVLCEKSIPYLREFYQRMPGKKWVMSVGACASSGGTFLGDSVIKGVLEDIPVDVFVPGCPPTPESLVEGIHLLRERIRQGIRSS